MNKCSLTVLFITLNEEYHIGAAIDNVQDLAQEIIVVDSGSTDRTVAIAEEKGAKVVYHQFESYGKQWNFALDQPIKTQWTMKMDPDERLPEALKNEMRQRMENPGESVAFNLVPELFFMGKRTGVRMIPVTRLWKTGSCRFSDVKVNEHLIVGGRVETLKNPYDHLDSQDLHHWLDKQNRYTTAEAQIRIENANLAEVPRLLGTSLQRRMWFKKWFYLLPGRYVLLGFYLYLMKGAWRGGWTGCRWVQMRILVMRLVEYKWIEMRQGHERG